MSDATYLERQRALELESEIGSMKQPRERRREERGHGNSKGTFPKCMSDTDRKQEEASHAHMKCCLFFCLSILGDYGKSIQSPSSNHSSEGRSKRLVLVGQGGKHQVWASNASFPIDLFYLIKDTIQYSYTFPSSTGKSWMRRTLEKDAVRCRFE